MLVFKALERLNITLLVDNAVAGGGSTFLNITSVSPAAVNASASLEAAAVQRDGSTNSTTWNATGPAMPLLSYSWHLLRAPVLLSSRARSAVFADPRLGAQLILSGPFAASVTSSSTYTSSTNTSSSNTASTAAAIAAPVVPLVYAGYWSSSSASYIIPFKLPGVGIWTGRVELLVDATSNNTLVSRCAYGMEVDDT